MAKTNEAGRVARLKAVPLFAGLPARSLQRVAQMMKEFDAAPGQVLVQPHMAASGMFAIEEGQVSVEAPKFKAQRGPGEVIGELALLTDGGRTARVRARTAVKGFAISRADFREVLESEPKMALSLLEVLAARMADQLA
jgi:CRP-like cAMP-binding protein